MFQTADLAYSLDIRARRGNGGGRLQEDAFILPIRDSARHSLGDVEWKRWDEFGKCAVFFPRFACSVFSGEEKRESESTFQLTHFLRVYASGAREGMKLASNIFLPFSPRVGSLEKKLWWRSLAWQALAVLIRRQTLVDEKKFTYVALSLDVFLSCIPQFCRVL